MNDKQTNEIIKYAAIIGGVYFLILKPILQKIGIEKTPEEKQESEAIKKIDFGEPYQNPFSGRLFLAKMPKGTILLTVNSAKNLSKIIRESFTNFGDNEQAVIGVFRQLKTQAQVASLADSFYKNYNLDLWTFLKTGTPNSDLISQFYTGLSDKDLSLILAIVNKLPKYK